MFFFPGVGLRGRVLLVLLVPDHFVLVVSGIIPTLSLSFVFPTSHVVDDTLCWSALALLSTF